MSQTVVRKSRRRREPAFPYRVAFERFLELVERAARACGASPEYTQRILEHLKTSFGKGIPEHEFEEENVVR